jgi:hypothetical protein
VVLVGERGRVLYERAVGEANREWHVPNTMQTHFRIPVAGPVGHRLRASLHEWVVSHASSAYILT